MPREKALCCLLYGMGRVLQREGSVTAVSRKRFAVAEVEHLSAQTWCKNYSLLSIPLSGQVYLYSKNLLPLFQCHFPVCF